jgi:hypothetical protein
VRSLAFDTAAKIFTRFDFGLSEKFLDLRLADPGHALCTYKVAVSTGIANRGLLPTLIPLAPSHSLTLSPSRPRGPLPPLCGAPVWVYITHTLARPCMHVGKPLDVRMHQAVQVRIASVSRGFQNYKHLTLDTRFAFLNYGPWRCWQALFPLNPHSVVYINARNFLKASRNISPH